MYKIHEIFDDRLSAIAFYKSIYDFTIKFKVLKTEIYLKEGDKFVVEGEVFLIGNPPGITEASIINHIKNNI